jgi:hypothetical protein
MGLPGRVQCHPACARVPSPVTTRDSDMPDGKYPDRPTRFGATRKHFHARFSRFRRENHASWKARRSAGWFAYHAVVRTGPGVVSGRLGQPKSSAAGRKSPFLPATDPGKRDLSRVSRIASHAGVW